MIQYLNTYASLITAIATIVLAIITGIYAYLLRRQTREYIEEIRNQTKKSARPKLAIRVNGKLDWEIENVGKGTAFDLKVHLCIPDKLVYEGYPLAPNEFFRITWDVQRFGELLLSEILSASSNGTLPMEISYRDIFDNHYQETINARAEYSTDAHNAALFVEVMNKGGPKFIIRL